MPTYRTYAEFHRAQVNRRLRAEYWQEVGFAFFFLALLGGAMYFIADHGSRTAPSRLPPEFQRLQPKPLATSASRP